jgi:hypothetical protein
MRLRPPSNNSAPQKYLPVDPDWIEGRFGRTMAFEQWLLARLAGAWAEMNSWCSGYGSG